MYTVIFIVKVLASISVKMQIFQPFVFVTESAVFRLLPKWEMSTPREKCIYVKYKNLVTIDRAQRYLF